LKIIASPSLVARGPTSSPNGAAAAAAIISAISGNVLGLAVANGWTELSWAVACVVLLTSALPPARRHRTAVIDTEPVAEPSDLSVIWGDTRPGRIRAMPRPTPREVIEQRLATHLGAEVELDVDATVASMAAEPWWENVALGFRASGRDAVRELYTRVIADFIPRLENFEEITTSFGDTQAVVEHLFTMRMPDGQVRTGRHLAIAVFDDGEMVGERVYCDAVVAELFRYAMREDWFDVPGVTALS
jgi:hypothetical protein